MRHIIITAAIIAAAVGTAHAGDLSPAVTTTITAEDIRAVNAHTLAEVLETIPGLQVVERGGPGGIAAVALRGVPVRVLIDGINLAGLDAMAVNNVGAIPVQQIERLEVRRGPQGGLWNATGGVINIITKAPSVAPHVEGAASGGSASFNDQHGEASGTFTGNGVYLSAGRISRSNLATGTGASLVNGTAKIIRAFAGGSVTASVMGITDGTSVDAARNVPTPRGPVLIRDTLNSDETRWVATVASKYAICPNLEFNAEAHYLPRGLYERSTMRSENGNPLLTTRLFDTSTIGSSVGLTWRHGIHTVNGGISYDYRDTTLETGQKTSRHLGKTSAFVTDTVTIGDLVVMPALRYDWMTTTDSHYISPSTAGRYHLTNRTAISASVGRGYEPLNDGSDRQRATWTAQAGVESAELGFVAIRATAFYTEAVAAGGDVGTRRRGAEIEVETAPIYNVTTLAGVSIMDRNNQRGPGLSAFQEPGTLWNVGVKYNDRAAVLTIAATGRYTTWTSHNSNQQLHDSEAFIVDIHSSKRLDIIAGSPELFVSVRNVFDGGQYTSQYARNAGRWAEAGLRFSF